MSRAIAASPAAPVALPRPEALRGTAPCQDGPPPAGGEVCACWGDLRDGLRPPEGARCDLEDRRPRPARPAHSPGLGCPVPPGPASPGQAQPPARQPTPPEAVLYPTKASSPGEPGEICQVTSRAHAASEIRSPPRSRSGGAGNRTRVRKASSSPSFTCVVAMTLTTAFVGFGRDLSLTNLGHAIEGILA